MRWPAVLFIFSLITAILHVDGGLTTNRPGSKQNGPMFSSEEIARSRIRAKAQQEILSKSRLDRGQSPSSPQSPQSGGSGASSPPLGGSLSPQFTRPATSKNPTYLQPAPPPRFPVARPATADTTAARKTSCASVCEKVFSEPAVPVCVFDKSTRELVTLRNTAHVACYRCLHPTHQVEVVPTNRCDGGQNRRKRWIGSP